MHKNFSFKGVVRSNDNIFANDGECLELVNLRMVNGSLRPVAEFVEEVRLQGSYSDIYRHEKASCYMCIVRDDERSIDFYDLQWKPMCNNQGAKLHFPLLKKVRRIEFMGYVAACMTDDGIRYLLYKDNTYRWLGDSPIEPTMVVSLSAAVHEVSTSATFTTDMVDTPVSSLWQYNSRSYFDECISKANKAGYYIDRALFRYALRLYDGSYIYTSHPVYVSNDAEINGVTRDSGNLVATKNDTSSSDSTYNVKVLGFKPQFKFENLKMDDWEGVVIGIDIFTTGSIMGKKVDEAVVSVLDTTTKVRTIEKIEVYKNKELDEIYEDVRDASLYYKIAEYSIWGKCRHSVDDVSQANIVLQDALSSFEQRPTMSSIVPECTYMFNNRLHLASLREYLFKGYGDSSLLPAGVGKNMLDMVVIRTKIDTPKGISTLLKRFENVYVGYDKDTFMLPPLLSYPDSRAFEMSVFIYYDTEWFGKRFLLTPHKYLNMSQYLHKVSFGYTVTVESVFANGGSATGALTPETAVELFGEQTATHEVIYSESLHGWTYKGSAFPPKEYSSLRIFAIPRNVKDGDKIVITISKSASSTSFMDIDNIRFDSTWEVLSSIDDCGEEENIYETRDDVMKVSLPENPFVFPARCTYSLSNGKVMALSTNRVAMSEGQFGEHPLYVFSQEGIKVMAVDASGKTAYSNVYPVSNEICCNADMVCGTDSGVLFLGIQGVMLISGNRCVRISAAMDDECKDGAVLEHSWVIKRIASIPGLGHLLDTEHFLDFMRGAKVMYHAVMDEMIFCNGDYGYCYIYSLSGNVWSKTDMGFVGYVKAGASSMMFRNEENSTYIYVPGGDSTGGNNVLLITRPHHFGTKLPKRIMQLMLHAYLVGRKSHDASSAFVSCFLLCSNDGVNFKLVTGCEKKNETQDVVFPYFPTQSYRYFIFALAGNLDVMSMITGLELDITPAWNNRLR